tara:strand:+ start:119 stop:331 length:213 start_codon:yes stop_codon:yes gene_type:complete
MKNNILNMHIILIALIIIYPVNAYAYINPSVFSFIGVLLAGAVTVIGFYFFRIIDFFERLFLKIKNFRKK